MHSSPRLPLASPFFMSTLRRFLALVALTAAAALATATLAHAAAPVAEGKAARMKTEKLAAMDAAVAEAIATKKTPGGVLWFERDGEIYKKAYGARALVPAVEPISEDTIYDAASLTKVIATTTSVLQLVERGKLNLDAPVVRYLPAFAENGKEAVTVRQLLMHNSGLRPDVDLKPVWSGYETGVALACKEKLRSTPGSAFVYSDINFIVLGELVRIASGRRLEVYAVEEIFRPLGMLATGFLPAPALLSRVAPTELTNGQMLRGVVHDPTTRAMGGVAGHAGLFLTVADLARFCRMLLGGGQLNGVRILSADTVAMMTRVQNDGSDRRGLGWDVDSRFSGPRGRWFPAGATFGHTGFTGTSVWIDPAAHSFLIFFANRVHPDGKGDVAALRRTLGTLAAEAIGRDHGAVLNGIDVLVREDFARLRGMRVGLITNQSGRDREGRATIDLLFAAKDVKLVALFSPEHGIRGVADDKVGDSIDEKTKLPVYSLYGESPPKIKGQPAADYDMAVIRARAPKPEQMRDLDALVFDIQDIGARFYTYSATLGTCLEAAALAKKKFFILDRINPIGGVAVEGPVMTSAPSFIGFHTMPVRHGMTLGELARMYNVERKFNADLVVVPCENWTRGQWLDETGLPWVNPSPSMRSLTAAILYPGLCLLESTQLSMGRGTMKPFEQVGAPFVDGEKLAAELNRAGIPGVRFEPVKFTPRPDLYPGPAKSLKHGDVECGGVRVVLLDRDHCPVVDIGLELALALQRLYPEHFKTDLMARLLGADATLADIKSSLTTAAIKANYARQLASFDERRQAYLLYPTAK
jgi:uncharacterized protein YbbC (DUF1343 family)/CubicO group peptidase (beta-lactamase class C family)